MAKTKKSTKAAALPIGEAVIVRTVTHYYTGKLDRVEDGFLVLSEAAWITDTGRWSEALRTGKLNEVEPYPNGTAVSIGCVVDVARWPHALPRSVL